MLTNTPPAQDVDNNLVAFPKSEISTEEQAIRLAAEVERLAAQLGEWRYYVSEGVAKKFGITDALLTEMIEATNKRNDKDERGLRHVGAHGTIAGPTTVAGCGRRWRRHRRAQAQRQDH